MTFRPSTAAPILAVLADLGVIPMKRQRIDALLLGLCAILGCGTIWFSATGGEPTVVLLATVPFCFLNMIIASALAYGRSLRTCARSVLLGPCVAVLVILSVTAANWPLRVSYALNRPAFDQLAKRVRAGEDMTMPRSVGLFKIRRAEVYHNGVTCLWTGLDPAGYTGFVQCGPDHVPFNLWSIVRLDHEWQFISED
jgi:hypothetical protein